MKDIIYWTAQLAELAEKQEPFRVKLLINGVDSLTIEEMYILSECMTQLLVFTKFLRNAVAVHNKKSFKDRLLRRK